ncbi:MAG TPA: hypothetical protein VK636_15060, partial [Gemmatimonadaceae bacterium]|nr:hypothetical protein [Gemmatimonadaceae bacterium]
DRARRLVTTRSFGVMTDGDVNEIRDSFAADPAFDPTYAQLSDLRDLTDADLSVAMMDRIAQTSVFRPSTRRAYVAHTPFQFGIARMFAGMSDVHGQRVYVFRTMTEAERWIAGAEADTGSDAESDADPDPTGIA